MLIVINNIQMRADTNGKIKYARNMATSRFIKHSYAQAIYDDNTVIMTPLQALTTVVGCVLANVLAITIILLNKYNIILDAYKFN